jgi:1-deoxy-D-xylulose-5-phosphate reductoisomerase
MTRPLRIAVLGSTGSIGRQALDVAKCNPERIEVVALSANSNSELLLSQAREHRVSVLALADPSAAEQAREQIRTGDPFSTVSSGADSLVDIAERDDVDMVLNALVGAAGLRATVATLRRGAKLALANKESLVVGGAFVTGLVTGSDQMLPVDSEHSAIFQCLWGEDARDVSRLWLTASGGPFRGWTREQLANVTTTQALAHPTWTMGAKISIDSATLMNKGLEVIEAHHLFGTEYDDIRVVVHPQSCIHSMVEFSDGSVKAHLGVTDMRIPIQYAFSHPRRWCAPVPPADFAQIGRMDFAEPDVKTFGCLALAFEAGRQGGTMPCVLNAANEVAVAAFLGGACSFLDIERTVADVMDGSSPQPIESVEQLLAVDAEARSMAEESLARR